MKNAVAQTQKANTGEQQQLQQEQQLRKLTAFWGQVGPQNFAKGMLELKR